ncbi:D-hexose-6-phosphate mutarotase [Granulicella arctica]|uniref:D-hexose-6-phosphate mutarotase n=1 Tax=Granulicella arctica TaxID=940613 RepID=UPI0021E059A8|nr:D-hexose-6-phosphate mutarotase [Granulicella arctica]
MTLKELQEQFGMPGVLSFHETPTGMIYVEVKTPAATATVYLQGAHLTHWQPARQESVLFMSRKSDFAPGKPIRGGVPIAFPWFATDSKADRVDGKPGPSHGFARIQDWTLAFAALSGEEMHLTFTLAPNALSKSMGFDQFRVAYVLTIGHALTMKLTVANDADKPLVFEEALHTYFAVGDVHETTLTGLEPTPYLDKIESFAAKPAAKAPLAFAAATDRIYNHTAATCVLHDGLNKRRIVVAKTNSDTTVVFNPWKAMADLGEDEWHEFLCVETVNASESPVTLQRGESHTMQAHISLEAGA